MDSKKTSTRNAFLCAVLIAAGIGLLLFGDWTGWALVQFASCIAGVSLVGAGLLAPFHRKRLGAIIGYVAIVTLMLLTPGVEGQPKQNADGFLYPAFPR